MTTRETAGYILHGTLGAEDVRALFERCASLRFSGLLELVEGPRNASVPFVAGEPLDGPDLFKLGAIWRRGSYRLMQRAVDFLGHLTDDVVLQGSLGETPPMQLFRHCEDRRLSAQIEIQSSSSSSDGAGAGQQARVRFAGGRLESAEVNGEPNMEALSTIGGWATGSFRLVLAPMFEGEAASAPPPRPPSSPPPRPPASPTSSVAARSPAAAGAPVAAPATATSAIRPASPASPAAGNATGPASGPAPGRLPSLFSPAGSPGKLPPPPASATGAGARPSPLAASGSRPGQPVPVRTPTAPTRPVPNFLRPAGSSPPAASGAGAPGGTAARSPVLAGLAGSALKPATAAAAGSVVGAARSKPASGPLPSSPTRIGVAPPAPAQPASKPAPAPPASAWELPDDEGAPPDAEWESVVESVSSSPAQPSPPPSSPAEASATAVDLPATSGAPMPDARDVSERSPTPVQVKAALPTWESEEVAPPGAIPANVALPSGGIPIPVAVESTFGMPFPTSRSREAAPVSPPVRSPIASLVLDDDLAPAPPQTHPDRMADDDARGRVNGEHEADSMESPFIAPFEVAPTAGDDAPPADPEALMPSVMAEGALPPEPTFPPPLLTYEAGGAPLDGLPQTPPPSLGWIWAGAITVLGGLAVWVLVLRTPPGLPTAPPPPPRPPPVVAQPVAPPAPPAPKAPPGRPAVPPTDPAQRLILAARKATIEGNKREALKLFKSAYKVSAKETAYAVYVPMALGKTGKATILLEGRGPVIVDGHKFDAPATVSVPAGPHTVELGGMAYDFTVEKDGSQRVSATGGIIPSAAPPGGATGPAKPAPPASPPTTAKPTSPPTTAAPAGASNPTAPAGAPNPSAPAGPPNPTAPAGAPRPTAKPPAIAPNPTAPTIPPTTAKPPTR